LIALILFLYEGLNQILKCGFDGGEPLWKKIFLQLCIEALVEKSFRRIKVLFGLLCIKAVEVGMEVLGLEGFLKVVVVPFLRFIYLLFNLGKMK
jgi:hypothetical protein